jgi:hypothetical protein
VGQPDSGFFDGLTESVTESESFDFTTKLIFKKSTFIVAVPNIIPPPDHIYSLLRMHTNRIDVFSLLFIGLTIEILV